MMNKIKHAIRMIKNYYATRKNEAYLTIALLGALLFAGSIAFGGQYFLPQDSYPDTPTSQLSDKMAKTEKRGISVLIFHKTGCSDCKHVQKQVVTSLQKSQSNFPKVNFVVMDYKNKAAKKYFKQFKITNVPTVIEIKHREETRRYSGINKDKIKSVIELDWSNWHSE
jgi:thiol-disulfide isomerase/thioredoxin